VIRAVSSFFFLEDEPHSLGWDGVFFFGNHLFRLIKKNDFSVG